MTKSNFILKRVAQAILLLASAALLPALAQAQFTYTTNADSTLTITGYTGPAGAVTIPTNINGVTVTGIAPSAFASNANIDAVTISGAITNLGSSLFLKCANLTNVTFGTGITFIANSEFDFCESLTSIVIPANVTSVGDYGFYRCSNLCSVTFASGVGSIGQYSFGYNGFTNLVIPATITNIGLLAFDACQYLTNATILGNCNIGPGAFSYSAPALPTESQPPNVLQSVYIAGGNIGDSAFSGCTNLSSLTFGVLTNSANSIGVTNLAHAAFQNCISLTSVVIPTNMIVGSNAFQNCTNLANITLIPGITSIGGGAFAYTGVTNLIVPATVTNIGPSAFSDCLRLTNVVIAGNCNINSFAFSFVQGFNTWLGSPDYALQNVYVAGGAISDYAFFICTNLATLTLGDHVSDIGEFAFAGTALKSVIIPGSCTNIGLAAFEGAGITNLSLAEGLQTIEDDAFRDNPITSLSLPASLRTISSEGFFADPITNLTILNGLTSIGTQCFVYARLTHVTIPASLTAMGDFNSFLYNSNLTAAVFLGNAPVEGTSTFTYCSSNMEVYYLPGTSGWSNTFAGIPTAVWNPTLQKHDGNFGLRNGRFGFNLTGPTNIPVAIQSCTNLGSGWTTVTNVTLTNGSFYFSDPQSVSNHAAFYHLAPPP